MRRLFRFLAACWCVAVLLAGPTAAWAGCYRTVTYFKQATPAYVTPTYYPQAAAVFVVPAVPVYTLGPGGSYSPPPPPAATTRATPCEKRMEALEARVEARVAGLERENALLRGMLGQVRPTERAPEPAPAAAPAGRADVSWLTVRGHKGGSCADCHHGADAPKGLDYSVGVERLTPQQLLRTAATLDGKGRTAMPPRDPKAYVKAGLARTESEAVVHGPVTDAQRASFARRLEELKAE